MEFGLQYHIRNKTQKMLFKKYVMFHHEFNVAKTYLSIIFTILLLTSIEYIGPTGGQPILLDLSLEPELTAEAQTSSNEIAIKRQLGRTM
jgi:hypothetical protein